MAEAHGRTGGLYAGTTRRRCDVSKLQELQGDISRSHWQNVRDASIVCNYGNVVVDGFKR